MNSRPILRERQILWLSTSLCSLSSLQCGVGNIVSCTIPSILLSDLSYFMDRLSIVYHLLAFLSCFLSFLDDGISDKALSLLPVLKEIIERLDTGHSFPSELNG